MPELKAIIFDLEGVVIDTDPIWKESAEIFLARHGRIYDEYRTSHLIMGKSIAEGARLLKEQYRFEGDDNELTEERIQIFTRLAEREIEFIPGFPEFFEQVRARYKTAVATSANRAFVRAFDQKLDLTSLFGSRIYSIEDIGFVSKPNPDIFLTAAQSIGVAPAHCVVIEDAPNGIRAAGAASMRSIALTTSTSRAHLAAAGPTLIADRFSDIDLTAL